MLTINCNMIMNKDFLDGMINVAKMPQRFRSVGLAMNLHYNSCQRLIVFHTDQLFNFQTERNIFLTDNKGQGYSLTDDDIQTIVRYSLNTYVIKLKAMDY